MNPGTTARGPLSSRPAAWTFVAIVFAVTLVQVLTSPVAAVIAGYDELPFGMPVTAAIAIVIAGCAAQAALLLLGAAAPQWGVAGTTAIYLAVAIGLQVPAWLHGMQLVVSLSLFLLASRSPLPVSALWLLAVLAGTALALFVSVLSYESDVTLAAGFALTQVAGMAGPCVGGVALGAWWAAQSRRMAVAREAAESAHQDHELRVAAAEQGERARIAQELHDVVGQHLAGLVTLADAAARLAPRRPGRALELVGEVREEGRFAAVSLAGALADIRATGTPRSETTRDLRQVANIVDYWCRRGVVVGLNMKGDMEALPAVISTTAYRAIQEALTNAAKHAPGSSVEVDITSTGDALEVFVVNAPSAPDSVPAPDLGLGWGLDAMQSRMTLLQGKLDYGSTPEGGWAVRFGLPRGLAEWVEDPT